MKRRGASTALRKQEERGASCFVESGERGTPVGFWATRRSTSTSSWVVGPSREVEAFGMCGTEDGHVGTAVASSLLTVLPGLALGPWFVPRPTLQRRPADQGGCVQQRLSAHRQHDRRAARASPELHAELQPFPGAALPW
jgi:hypothetical protein